MKKNKVIIQLQSLSPKEFRLFGKFIKNLTHGKKETLSRLYEYITKYYPEFDSAKFNKRNCFLYIFPELKNQLQQLNGDTGEFISKKIKNPFYDLKKLIDDFIIHQELSLPSHEKTILLIKGLFKRNMHKKAFQLIDKELKRLKGVVGDDFYHHFYQFQLIELKLNNSLDIVNETGDKFKNLHNHLDLFFAHTKIKYGFEVRNRNKLLYEKNHILYFDETKQMIDNGNIPNSNLSMILYSKITDLANSTSRKDYFDVKQFYFRNLANLCKKEQKEPLIYLLNFSAKKYKAGKIEYIEEMFDLYNFGLQNDILIEKGHLSINDFKNIVVISTTLKKYNWAKDFVSSKSFLLPENLRESAIIINKAQIEGSLKNNAAVIELLRGAEFHNVYDNLTARSLMMRSYYDLKEFTSLNSFLESYYKYIKRNKLISENEKLPFLNMIKFTKMLISENLKKSNKEELKLKLNNLLPINNKTWFQIRIDEL